VQLLRLGEDEEKDRAGKKKATWSKPSGGHARSLQQEGAPPQKVRRLTEGEQVLSGARRSTPPGKVATWKSSLRTAHRGTECGSRP
jgi:hypothetical protein